MKRILLVLLVCLSFSGFAFAETKASGEYAYGTVEEQRPTIEQVFKVEVTGSSMAGVRVDFPQKTKTLSGQNLWLFEDENTMIVEEIGERFVEGSTDYVVGERIKIKVTATVLKELDDGTIWAKVQNIKIIR